MGEAGREGGAERAPPLAHAILCARGSIPSMCEGKGGDGRGWEGLVENRCVCEGRSVEGPYLRLYVREKSSEEGPTLPHVTLLAQGEGPSHMQCPVSEGVGPLPYRT